MNLKTSNVILVGLGAFLLAIFANWILSPFLSGSFSRNLIIFYLVSALMVVIPFACSGILLIMRRNPHALVFCAILGLLLLFFNLLVYWLPFLRVPYL